MEQYPGRPPEKTVWDWALDGGKTIGRNIEEITAVTILAITVGAFGYYRDSTPKPVVIPPPSSGIRAPSDPDNNQKEIASKEMLQTSNPLLAEGK